MAVYTKLRRRRICRLYADSSCYESGELVRVWTLLEHQRTPVKRLISDLIADRGLPEIIDIVRAEATARRDPHTPISIIH
jgi:hypothetical protein